MTDIEKRQIQNMRTRGMSFSQIGQALGIATATIKSFCYRRGIVADTKSEKTDLCLCCGTPIRQDPRRKTKKFCSDKCRLAWWARNTDKLNRKAMYEYDCAGCGRKFQAYGNSKRRFCSHQCYIKSRFGGGADD